MVLTFPVWYRWQQEDCIPLAASDTDCIIYSLLLTTSFLVKLESNFCKVFRVVQQYDCYNSAGCERLNGELEGHSESYIHFDIYFGFHYSQIYQCIA